MQARLGWWVGWLRKELADAREQGASAAEGQQGAELAAARKELKELRGILLDERTRARHAAATAAAEGEAAAAEADRLRKQLAKVRFISSHLIIISAHHHLISS